MHIIGQQLDRIEEKIVEKTVFLEKSLSIKTKKPLIDLPSQREKDMFKTSLFKTSQSKTLEIVEKILSNLKVKTKGTLRNTACTISRNEKEIVSDTDSDIVSSVSMKRIFDDDLLEIKRFVRNSKPMSFTKNWYSKPIPPNM